jgi:CRISPR-associated protein Cmr1
MPGPYNEEEEIYTTTSRTAPPPPTSGWKSPCKSDELTLELKIIIPVFGGDFEARELHPVNLIRAGSIRGHLRFWWRATAGARYASAE